MRVFFSNSGCANGVQSTLNLAYLLTRLYTTFEIYDPESEAFPAPTKALAG